MRGRRPKVIPPLPQSGQPAPGRPTILLVDDDSAVLESLTRVLATEGWQVIGAASGEEALDRMTQFQPALLITDLCMADVSGWDLLFHENLHRPNLPIFVITALPPSIVGGADHFAAEFFQKPLDLYALIAQVHVDRRHRPSLPDGVRTAVRSAQRSAGRARAISRG